ncbi:murein biosynthesis integral membrane protein MurJ [Geomesophilobacter sediminis]|uniref:Probable lipid II flippase MurJ n=1 Tax=Geomesophilobacter sediminis TaxID=2798584 RepID=A0A8J7SAT3_9BACT|nr:murein biosynthesis integral membrane protein MurJ [Geomesophilobacter sediminis]MBJ6727660.1 murein biosynthesis integral membrane protein MurJ [Geomesophilobacter sediminis]
MSEKKHIARAAGVLGAATMLSRIMGMVRDMVVSHLFGAGLYTDAFFAAFQIPNMLRRFFAEGALTSAFVPTFSEWYTNKGPDEARDLANVCFTVLTIVMAAITLVGIVFSPQIIAVMFPGFATNPEKVSMTIMMNRLMFPYIFFVSMVALCMGILNTVRHFFTPAVSTVFLNASMIVCALTLHQRFRVPIVALAVGVLVGGVLQLLLQLPVLYRKGFALRPNFDFKHPAVRRIGLLMGPSIFGVGVYYLNITVGSILASLLAQGSVSYLYYAQRLFEFPQGIFTVSVAQAVLPSMSRQAAAGDLEALKESLGYGVRLTLFITVPAMVGLLICATPIFSLLFMGGAFDYAKAANCGVALSYYSLGICFVALVRVLVPAFYALKDTKTPVFCAFIAFLLNFLFSVILMRPLLHGGLAFASSLSAVGNMGLLVYYLRQKIGPFGGRDIVRSASKALAASVPMGAVVYFVLQLADWTRAGEKVIKGGVLGGAIGAGMVLFLICAHVFGSEEARDVLGTLKRKLGRSASGP